MCEIPLMFQAQVEGRGQIQYIGTPEKAEQWVKEWLDGSSREVPEFPSNAQTKDYKITWRVVSNSGQDEGIIRPVFGAQGWPFYPGASMKGAFLRACSDEEALEYCGGKLSQQDTKPGILRFHGGYPKDGNWKQKPEQLVDLVHPQEDWQVKNNSSHSANIQISLYQPTLVFGISSTVKLSQDKWDKIWDIWKRAIERGIGSRVSAGYGQPINHGTSKLLTVNLEGQGLASLLAGTNPIPEFRPNMFKAALRGHTLRLFSGVTDEATAQELTKELWGGFAGRDGAIVGLLGIAFNYLPGDLDIGSYPYKNNPMPTYDLTDGTLSILCMRQVSEDERKKLGLLTTRLIKFSLLLGAFGKSWRRVDHRLFFPQYLIGNLNPMIGCHWKFKGKPQRFYIPVNELKDVTAFLDTLRKSMLSWLRFKRKQPSDTICAYREAWHPQKVQVWGRIAKDKSDSKAVRWFHGPYTGADSIKSTDLTGGLGKIGRIWHRMYPRYITNQAGNLVDTGEYVELLTIFPDNSDTTKDFINFLNTKNSGFTKIWGE